MFNLSLFPLAIDPPQGILVYGHPAKDYTLPNFPLGVDALPGCEQK